MITWYFCRKILVTFIIVLTALTGVLSIVNVLSKNIFSSMDLIVALFLGATPFLAVFIFPFALLLSCFFVLYVSYERGEFVLFEFYKPLQNRLKQSFLLVVLITTSFFVPLVLWIAPQSYDWGKQLLYSIVEQRFSTLTPGVLHFPINKVATYFESIKVLGTKTEFKNFFLIEGRGAWHTYGVKHLLWGREVYLFDKKLWFKKGSFVQINKKNNRASLVFFFDEGVFDLQNLIIFTGKKRNIPFKYQTINQLLIQSDFEAKLERCRRYLQILWVMLTPLIAYWITFTFIIKKFSWLFGVAGIWFFILYLVLFLLPLLFKITPYFLSFIGGVGFLLVFFILKKR